MSQRFSLKLKVTLAICSLLVLSTLTLGWVVRMQVREMALRELQETGEVLARGLATRSVLGALTHSSDLLQVALAPLDGQEDVAYAAVADERGRILIEHRGEDVLDVPEWTGVGGVSLEGGGEGGRVGVLRSGVPVFYFLAPVVAGEEEPIGGEIGMFLDEATSSSGPRRVGSVCIGVSAADVVHDLRGLSQRLMLTMLAVLAAGVGIAVLLVRVIVDPVKQLVHATRRIAHGDLDIVLPSTTGDEIGILASAFNQMTDNLRTSRRELETINAELERNVQERTRALREAQDQLVQAEKMTVVGQLVSGVAHELNNPLAGVLGYSQLMLRRGVGEEVRRGLMKIVAEAERCKRIVQNLLIFARKHKPRKTLVDLNDVIESTLDLRAYHLEVENVTIVRDLEPGLPRTMADTNQLQQVLLNVINNAQHSMVRSGRPPVLTLRSRHREGRILIEVEDNGCGIAPENMGKIFDPFFTTKEVGQGTGLGLSICYGIVQEHKGAIRVESKPGSGAVFVIDLPVVVEGAGSERPPAESTERDARPQQPGRILLVDDEPSILDVMGDVLRMDGHEVVATTNGAHALARLGTERFDVIVSDLKMPGIGGQELFQRLGEMDADLARRVIFTTGDLASPQTLAFLEKTGNPYLQKPFDLNLVRRVVHEMLAGAAAGEAG
ncbi:MAG: ATP-binding protein [Acidobacteriota bacterium]